MQQRSISLAWRWMLAVKAAIWAAIFIYKTQKYPGWQYEHLLVDYHFGIIKRALLGTLTSLVFTKVPVGAVFVIGGGIWLVTLGFFVAVFVRVFGRDVRALPLFVLMAASPFTFANFLQNVGYTDIIGCLWALVLLLIPARSFVYVIVAVLGAMALILFHHIQALMYVPTLGAIVVARYYLAERRSPIMIVAGLATLLPLAALLLFAQFAGSPPLSEADFTAYMRARMAAPVPTPVTAGMWYTAFGSELAATAASFGKNALRLPIYLLAFAAHWPLIVFFRDRIAALAAPLHRRLAWLAVALISLAYLVIFVVAFDYSRWVSNWMVCMMLLLFAIRSLPARSGDALIADDAITRRCGWIVTAIPRIGTTIPF